MDLWTLSVGYAGCLAVCSLWAGEWARRKGLNVKAWRFLGLTAGPLAVIGVCFRKAEASLCPHCKTPIRFEERYCATCRAMEQEEVVPIDSELALAGSGADEGEFLVPHSFFESTTHGFQTPAHAS